MSENIYQCDQCDKSFKTKEALAGHLQKHTMKKQKCSTCNLFVSNYNYVNHISQRKKCINCEQLFCTSRGMDKDGKYKRQRNPETQFCSSTCRRNYYIELDNGFFDKVECITCNLMIAKSLYKRHLDKRKKCLGCGKLFCMGSGLDENNKRKQQKRNNVNYCSYKCSSNSEKTKTKRKETYLKNYGVEYNTQKHYSKETFEILNSKEKFNEFMKDKTIKIAADILKIDRSGVLRQTKKYNTQYEKARSTFEIEMEKFLDENNIEYIQNDRQQINPKELDFYIPQCDLAIECNGKYWHSLLPEGYHWNKYQLCKKRGIKLLHIWEILWNENRDQMKEFILENI